MNNSDNHKSAILEALTKKTESADSKIYQRGCCMTAQEVREWLKTLPELTDEELYNMGWYD